MCEGLTFREAMAFAHRRGLKGAVYNAAQKMRGWRAHKDCCKTAEDARVAGVELDDVLWTVWNVAKTNPQVRAQLYMWLTDCAARVLPLYESASLSPIPRHRIETVRALAHKGEFAQLEQLGDGIEAYKMWNTATDEGKRTPALAAKCVAMGVHNLEGCCTWALIARWAVSEAAPRHKEAEALNAEREWQYKRLAYRLSGAEVADLPLVHTELVPV